MRTPGGRWNNHLRQRGWGEVSAIPSTARSPIPSHLAPTSSAPPRVFPSPPVSSFADAAACRYPSTALDSWRRATTPPPPTPPTSCTYPLCRGDPPRLQVPLVRLTRRHGWSATQRRRRGVGGSGGGSGGGGWRRRHGRRPGDGRVASGRGPRHGRPRRRDRTDRGDRRGRDQADVAGARHGERMGGGQWGGGMEEKSEQEEGGVGGVSREREDDQNGSV